MIDCKYKFNFLLVLWACVGIFILYFSSCSPRIYYNPEYLQGLALKAEIDSFNKAKKLEAIQLEKKRILDEKKRVSDSLQNIKKVKKDAKLKVKKERQEKRQKAKEARLKAKNPVPVAPKDTTAPKKDTTTTTKPKDTATKPAQTTPTPTKKPVKQKEAKQFRVSKDAIDSKVTQAASDAAIFDKSGNIRLIGGTSNQFKDMNLSSDTMVYNYADKQMRAIPRKDTSGNLSNTIDFRQGQKLFRMESMMYNPSNKKAILDNVHTKEGELYIHTEEVRQVNDSLFYGRDGVFSTCSYFPPHFSFYTKKYKLVRGRTIVTGSLYVNFEGVPIPPKIFLVPFAILPMPKERNSGVIIPEIQPYGTNGFSLSNGGYYFVFNPYLDLKVLGTYSALGVYSLSLASNFIKKYQYNGNVALDFQILSRGNNPEDADYQRAFNYKINTTYNLNRNVNPTITFNANINYVSNSEYNVLANNLSTQDRLNNSFNTNVSFSKQIRKGFIQSISTSLSISQNTNNNLMDISFPNINLSTRPINPVYVLLGGQNLGTKWYDKLRLGYSLNFSNKGSIRMDNFSVGKFLDTSSWNASQSFPLELSLPKLGPLVIAPNVTYSQDLVDRRTYYKWNGETVKLDTVKERGIFPRHRLSFGASFNFEDLIATLQLGPNSRLRALRHVIRFTTGFTYTPDIKEYEFFNFQKNAQGEVAKINYFDGSSYRRQESGNLNFSMNNIIQAKWIKRKKPQSDTGKVIEEEKKIDLISFTLGTSYDLIADSFRLANINMNYTTRISDKLTLSGSFLFDPYVYDAGRKTPRLLVENLFGDQREDVPYSTLESGLVSLSSASLSFSYGFRGGDKKQSNTSLPPAPAGSEAYPGERYDIINQTRDLVSRNPNNYIDFTIPWSLNIGVSGNYSRGTYDATKKAFNETINSNLNLSGEVKLTEKWKLSASGMYDLIKTTLTSFNVNLSRDLHCWQLTIMLTPIGPIKSFGFIVRPKATILQDLKLDQTRSFF